MRIILLGLSLMSLSANAANILIIDSGLYPEYRAQLVSEKRLLDEGCISEPDDERRKVATDLNNTTHSDFYEYKYASLCRNGGASQTGAGASLLRMTGLPGAVRRDGNEGASVPVTTTRHQSVIAKVIRDNTSASVKQWHIHDQSLLGVNLAGQVDWTNYNLLDQVGSWSRTATTLASLGLPGFRLRDTRAINISASGVTGLDEEERFATPCDNHPDVTKDGAYRDLTREIARLRNQGVVTFAATANTEDDQALDNYVMPFPACLSTTVAVGGLNDLGQAEGAISPHTDFIIDDAAIDLRTNMEIYGTSYATPKVASHLVELLTINPYQSVNTVLNTLRNTADLQSGEREYGSTSILYQIAVPNFSRAKGNLISNFWKEFIQLFNDETNPGLFGWNYGTSTHENGILSYFQTDILQQKNANLRSKQSQTSPFTQAEKSSTEVLRFSFRPYDIDTSDELEVLVNDKSYGFVDTTGSNQLGGTQTFCIALSDLKSDGTNNEVKLALKTPRLTYGVKNLRIENGTVDANCKTATTDPVDEDEVSLTVGETDTNQYGRDYGRDNNTSQLDVLFTPEAGLSHELSWQPYDIESNEMEVFLNDEKIKTIPPTSNNSLGAVDSVTIQSGDFISGVNTLSFRIIGGDDTWGITNLSVTAITSVPGDSATTVIADSPDSHSFAGVNGPYELSFDFTPRGPFYDETLKIKFETLLKFDVVNGFQIHLNGRRVRNIGTYTGRSNWIARSFSLDKSEFRIGSNTLKIYATSSVENYNIETSIRNVKVISESDPLLDLSVNSLSVDGALLPSKPFNAAVTVLNVGAKRSSSNTVSFYASASSNQSNPVLVGSTSIAAIDGGASEQVTSAIDASAISNGDYLWACIDQEAGDINASNNCSESIQIDFEANIVPIIMLLLD